MILDTHTHPFGDPSFVLSEGIKARRDVIVLRKRNPELFKSRWRNVQDLTDLLVEDMSSHGIDKAIIQPGFGENPEQVAKAVRKHPDRLAGLFGVGHEGADPTASDLLQRMDWDEVNKQIKHYVEELGLRGMGEVLVGRFSSESAPERIARDLFPLMEILAKYRMPVEFPTAWTQFATRIYHGVPLFVDDLAERFPEVPIVITKMGRGYFFLFEMVLAIAFKHLNVYFDTVQAPPDHIARAVREIGSDRVMFGTDWSPTWRALSVPADIYTRSLATIDESGISENDKEWVLWKTGATLFKL